MLVERWCETQEGDAMTLSSVTPKIHTKEMIILIHYFYYFVIL